MLKIFHLQNQLYLSVLYFHLSMIICRQSAWCHHESYGSRGTQPWKLSEPLWRYDTKLTTVNLRWE